MGDVLPHPLSDGTYYAPAVPYSDATHSTAELRPLGKPLRAHHFRLCDECCPRGAPFVLHTAEEAVWQTKGRSSSSMTMSQRSAGFASCSRPSISTFWPPLTGKRR